VKEREGCVFPAQFCIRWSGHYWRGTV